MSNIQWGREDVTIVLAGSPPAFGGLPQGMVNAVGRCALGEAEVGLLLARYLFPHNRLLYNSQMEASIQCGLQLFDRGEDGHPANVGRNLQERLLAANWRNTCTIVTTETKNANDHDALPNQRIATR